MRSASPDGALFGVVDDRAAERELDSRVGRRLRGLLQQRVHVEADVLRLRVVLHGDERDLAPSNCSFVAVIRCPDARDVRQLLEVRDARLDRRLHLRIGDTLRRVEHDGGGGARLTREPRLEQVERLLRLRARDLEGVVGLAVEGDRDDDAEHGGHEPGTDEPPVVPGRAPSEAVEHSRHADPSYNVHSCRRLTPESDTEATPARPCERRTVGISVRTSLTLKN